MSGYSRFDMMKAFGSLLALCVMITAPRGTRAQPSVQRRFSAEEMRASSLIDAGQLDEAGAILALLHQEAVRRHSARALSVVGGFEGELDVRRGRFDLAEQLLQQVLPQQEKLVGQNNPVLLGGLESLADAYRSERRLPDRPARFVDRYAKLRPE